MAEPRNVNPTGRRRGDQEFLERAAALAIGVATDAVESIADFVRRGAEIGERQPPDDARVDRTIGLAADGLDRVSDAMRRATSDEQGRFEEATVELVRVVAPRVIGAAARTITGRHDLRDEDARGNTVRIARELAGLGTSLINDSVGGAERFGAGKPLPAESPAISVSVGHDETSATFELENIGIGPASDVTVQVTPLFGEGGGIVPSDVSLEVAELEVGGRAEVHVTIPGDAGPGAYRGYVYASGIAK